MKQYQDVTMTGQVDQYLFGIGQHFEVYERFGAHLTEKDGMEGVWNIPYIRKKRYRSRFLEKNSGTPIWW